jgi:ABC-type Fe3+/spermidine/putrescine transport system ATPase subunit
VAAKKAIQRRLGITILFVTHDRGVLDHERVHR